jgi:hypothetical protein
VSSTHPNDLVLSTSGEVSTIRTETDTSNIQITIEIGAGILQVADLLTGPHVEDLGTAIAACCDVLSVVAEANAAHNTLMGKIVNEVNFESAAFSRVVDRMPVFTLALEVWWKLFRVEVR